MRDAQDPSVIELPKVLVLDSGGGALLHINERIIKLFKKFNVHPHPPRTDFDMYMRLVVDFRGFSQVLTVVFSVSLSFQFLLFFLASALSTSLNISNFCFVPIWEHTPGTPMGCLEICIFSIWHPMVHIPDLFVAVFEMPFRMGVGEFLVADLLGRFFVDIKGDGN